MQHTTQYQFNLMEGTDKFLPGPLNENMEKVEAALSKQLQLVLGTYSGTGRYVSTNPNSLTFDFTPYLLIISADGGYHAVWFRGMTSGMTNNSNTYGSSITWEDKTVTWFTSAGSAAYQLNLSDRIYRYLAVGLNP